MPELPEVQTTVNALEPRLSGLVVISFRCHCRQLRQPVPAALGKRLVGHLVRRIYRRAKYIIVEFDDGALILHLGMSGSLRLTREPTTRLKHDHLEWRFNDGSILYFHDPRRFGLCLWTTSPPLEHPLLARLGPEPLDDAFNAAQLKTRLAGRRASIKSALMDATIIVGIGNIYASEALFRAGIRPDTPAGTLGEKRLARLLDAIRATLDDALVAGGSSLRDYVHADGASGWFQLQTFVYGREEQPCRVCGTTIRSTRHNQRTTYYCPRCQK
jgi:formamidopyrimidine-DNA glycosylase (fpg)